MRALLRAAAYGEAQDHAADGDACPPNSTRRAALLDEERRGARRPAGRTVAMPPLGIMVEVPAAAVASDLFDARLLLDRLERSDAIRRPRRRATSARSPTSPTPLHPGVLRLDRATSRGYGRDAGRDVSLCGDAGGDPAVLPAAAARRAALALGRAGRARRAPRRRSPAVDLREATGHEPSSAGEPRRSRRRRSRPTRRILREVLDSRPSGTRQRLADALGKNRSFVSQIANPGLPDADPGAALETIFEVCHFSHDERRAFLAAYAEAHPGAARRSPPPRRAHARHRRCRARPRRRQAATRRSTSMVAEFVRKLGSHRRRSD